MIIGKITITVIEGYDKQEVIETAERIAAEQNLKVYNSLSSHFKLFKMRYKYIIDLYCPLEHKLMIKNIENKKS